MAERLEIVNYLLNVGEDTSWLVRRFSLGEGISQTYELRLDLMNDDPTQTGEAMLGKDALLEIVRGEDVRLVYGVVDRVEYVGITSDKAMIRIRVVPAFRLLAHDINTTIFQDITVPEIFDLVLAPALEAFGRTLSKDKLSANYPKRDYCVRYGESMLDFASRLMEEEGIAYFFAHAPDAGVEDLVLVDDVDDHLEIPSLEGDPVPIIPLEPETAEKESVRFFDWIQTDLVNMVTARSYNWKLPPADPLDAPLEAEQKVDPAPHGRTLELFVHTDRRKIVDKAGDDAFDGSAIDEVAPMALHRFENITRKYHVGRGRSNVTQFVPGQTFVLGGDHAREEVEMQPYLLTRVIHTGDLPEVEALAAATAEQRYSNTFEAIPGAGHQNFTPVFFRPELVTSKPRVWGPQTAVVTGPSGTDEIHTDQHGRIKVRFHWDRQHVLDDTSSCWVRVAQTWAGPGWGAVVIPRIGMEVVVAFLDGNPDRPLVVGCVYNGTNRPPYTLPDEKTKSTFKSQSTPNAEGFNELRFEDAKGSEEVFLHAQKDLNEKVENNHSLGVGVDQSYSIGGSQTISVEGDRKITVKGNQSVTIKGEADPGGKGMKGHEMVITGHYKVDASDTIFQTAPTSIELVCKGSSIKLEPGKITIAAGDGATIVLDANALMKADGGGKILLDANALVTSNDGSKVVLDANALLKSSGGSKVVLDGNALVEANSGAKVVLDANALVKGGEAHVAGDGVASVKASDTHIGTGTITIKGSSVGIDGGGGTGKFAGGMVKLNS